MENLTDQNDKAILKEYYDRLNFAHNSVKFLHLRYLWDFMHSSNLFKPLCIVTKEKAHQWHYTGAYEVVYKGNFAFLPKNHEQRLLFSYMVLDHLAESTNLPENIIQRIGKAKLDGALANDKDYFDVFNNLIIEPLVFHFIHTANRKIQFHQLLANYKQRTEWFNAIRLLEAVNQSPAKSEYLLTSDLYNYLFDNGIQMYIEPISPAGRVDVIASEKNVPGNILIEGKVFDGNRRGVKYIIQGFHQVLEYAKIYTEEKAYMVIYNISQKHLSIDVGKEGVLSLYTGQNKNFYFLVIDLFEHDKSASKRAAREICSITMNDLKVL